jgi:YVTN family beta-propeller protein
MLRRVLTLGILLALVSISLGSARLYAQTKTIADYDPKTLAVVVNRDSSDVALIDPATDQVIKRIPLGEYTNGHMTMLSHDGQKLLVTATGRDRFLVVDLATGKVEHTVIVGKAPEHFDVTPDGRRAFVGNIEESTVSMIDVHDGREVQRITGFFEPHGFSALPDGSKVYVSSLGGHEVAVLDATSGRMLKRLAIGDVGRVAARDPQRYLSEVKGIVNPTLTKDGAFAYAADGDAGVVAIIDTKTDKIVKTLKIGEQPWRAYNSPDGRWMLIPNNGDSTVSVIDTKSQKVVAQLTAGSDMTGINYALDGSKAYVISRGDSTVYVFNMQTFGLVTRLKLTQGTANLALETAATTADGTKIYLASSTNDSVYVIDARTDQVKQIKDVGRYPWGVHIMAAASPNYCH